MWRVSGHSELLRAEPPLILNMVQSLLYLMRLVRFGKPHSGHDGFGFQSISEESRSVLDIFLRECDLWRLSRRFELLDYACRVILILASSSDAGPQACCLLICFV